MAHSSRPSRSSRDSKSASPRQNRRSAFARKQQQLAHEAERVSKQLEETRRQLEEAPIRAAARREEEHDLLARNANGRLVRLDAMTGAPSAIGGSASRPRRRTKAQRDAEYAQLFLLAILCAGLVFFAIQLFL